MAKGNFSLDDDENENSGAQNTQENSATSAPGVEAHAAQIIEQSPQVQEHAIAEAARQRAAEESQIPVDDHGVKFDPKIHTGSKLKSGHWRTKKGASTLGTPTKKSTAAKTGEVILSAEAEQKARAAGAAAANMLFASATMLFGEEFQPRSEKEAGFDEKSLMEQAFGDYFVAKNVADFPPGVTLAFVSLGYVTARLSMPKTKAKVSGFKTWLALRIARYKLKKEFKKAGIIARVEIKDGVLMVNGKSQWEQPKEKTTEEKKK